MTLAACYLPRDKILVRWPRHATDSDGDQSGLSSLALEHLSTSAELLLKPPRMDIHIRDLSEMMWNDVKYIVPRGSRVHKQLSAGRRSPVELSIHASNNTGKSQLASLLCPTLHPVSLLFKSCLRRKEATSSGARKCVWTWLGFQSLQWLKLGVVDLKQLCVCVCAHRI